MPQPDIIKNDFVKNADAFAMDLSISGNKIPFYFHSITVSSETSIRPPGRIVQAMKPL